MLIDPEIAKKLKRKTEKKNAGCKGLFGRLGFAKFRKNPLRINDVCIHVGTAAVGPRTSKSHEKFSKFATKFNPFVRYRVGKFKFMQIKHFYEKVLDS